MGVIQSKRHNCKSNQQTPELYDSTSASSDNYSKEIAAYQQAVYHNHQPSHQILNKINDITCPDLERRTTGIQSKYANSIAILNNFWTSSVNTLSDEEYSALALQFYTNVFKAIPKGQHIFLARIKRDAATQSKIFFGMFGWLVSAVSLPDSTHLLHKISVLGKLHQQMGIKLEYYLQMGGAFHETMSDFFALKYTLRVRFCFNTLYEIVVNIMMGLDFHNKCKQQKDKMADFVQHINDLMYCLENDDALEYFELYMKQHFCSELALFYKDYKMYKLMNNDTERTVKGEEMKKLYIDKNSEREINISYQHKITFIEHLSKNGYDENVFDVFAHDVIDLIRRNFFTRFKEEIQKIYQEMNTNKRDENVAKLPKEFKKQNWNFLVNRLNQTTVSD